MNREVDKDLIDVIIISRRHKVAFRGHRDIIGKVINLKCSRVSLSKIASAVATYLSFQRQKTKINKLTSVSF